MSQQGSASFQDEAKRISHAFIGASFGWLVITSETHLWPVLALGALFIIILIVALVSTNVSEGSGGFITYIIPCLQFIVR